MPLAEVAPLTMSATVDAHRTHRPSSLLDSPLENSQQTFSSTRTSKRKTFGGRCTGHIFRLLAINTYPLTPPPSMMIEAL